MATLTKAQLFDRREWLNKVRNDARTRKAVRIKLRPDGMTLNELSRYIGPAFAVTQNGDSVIVALEQSQPLAG